MKTFLVAFFMLTHAHASFQIKPGKWKIESTLTSGGKTVNPTAKLSEAMKKMTPEQKKQMETLMAKMGNSQKTKNAPQVGFEGNGMTMCYTKEMLESGAHFNHPQEKQNCKISDQHQSPQQVTMSFTCADGSSGNTVWNIVDDEHMNGINKITTAKGQKSEIKYKAQYLTSKCN